MITRTNLYSEALRRSKIAVKEELRDKGIRLSSFKASELTAMAKGYLQLNRSALMGRALGDLCWYELARKASQRR
jgi:hypothetical protein